MRKVVLLLLLVLPAFLGACSDATGVGSGRSVEGRWTGVVDGEDIVLTLSEDDGQIWGSGSWGFDAVTVTGNRARSDVSLVFEFTEYQPINFQGTVQRDRLEGWVTGSGYTGQSVSFWRD